MSFFKDVFSRTGVDQLLDITGKQQDTMDRIKATTDALRDSKSPESISAEAAKASQLDLNGLKQFESTILEGNQNLGRSTDNADIMNLRNLYRNRLGTNNEQTALARSQALQQLDNTESTQRRNLNSTLGRSGVTGAGAAAAALELNEQSQRNRATLEENLALKDLERQDQNFQEYASFEDRRINYDIGQQEAERAQEINTRLTYANIQENARQAIYNRQAAEISASLEREKIEAENSGFFSGLF